MRRHFALLALAGLGAAALVVLPAADASAVPDTTPALAFNGAGGLSLVWRSASPAGFREQSTVQGRWGAATPFTGARPVGDTGGVGLGHDPLSRTTLTATVAGGQVWARTAAGGRWSALGGSATGAPAVAALGRGAFAVVVRDPGGTVRVRYLRAGKWSRWTSLGGTFSTSPAAAGRAGSLVVAAAGHGREVRTAVVTGGRSTGWRSTGAISTATPGLATEPGTGVLHLITRNADLTPSARTSADGARTWGRATRLAGRLGSGIAAVSGTSGTADIVALSLGGQPVQAGLRSGGWGGFRLITSPGATVLAPDAVTAVTGDPAGIRTLTFPAGSALPEPGEILAAAGTPATPDGLLVKVVSVTGRAVRATPAKLTEAVPEGTFTKTFALRGHDGPVVQPIRATVTCGAARAEITGSVTLTPGFTLTASWNRAGGVPTASLTGTLIQDTQLRTSITGAGTCAPKETALLPRPLRFQPVVFAVGPVPVVITPLLQVYVDTTGSVRAGLETAAGQTTTLRAGLAHRNGTTTPTGTITSRYTYGPPRTGGNAETGVRSAFGFLMYGLPGPRLTTRASVRLDSRAPKWTLGTGMTAGVDLTVPQLGLRQSRDDVLNLTRTLATETGPARPAPPRRER